LPRKIIALIAAPTVVLALAGCDKTLKTDSIEPQIEKTIEQSGTQVTSVDCPGDVTAKKGNKFNCTAKLANGKEVKVAVTQTDSKGHVVFVPKVGAQAK
jgi:Domain of unknown function (DUF4333)